MRKGFSRGLLIGVAVATLVALFTWFRYGYASPTAFFGRVSTSLFQFGLVFLMLGVVIFSRLFSYRRRMGLKNYWAMLRARTEREYEANVQAEEEANEKEAEDKAYGEEKGRDATLLIASLFMIVISIVLTINQVK